MAVGSQLLAILVAGVILPWNAAAGDGLTATFHHDMAAPAPADPLHLSTNYYGPSSVSAAGDAFVSAFLLTLISEIGDKTFIIAAIMSMRHSKWTVFWSAYGAVASMTVLSVMLGALVPSVLTNRALSQLATAILFAFFGIRMLREGCEMKEREEKEQLMLEVTADLARPLPDEDDLESATPTAIIAEFPSATSATASSSSRSFSSCPSLSEDSQIRRKGHVWLAGESRLLVDRARGALGKVAVEAFTLTFIAEWGDRSQISAIALGASKSAYMVTLGTLLAHAICTAAACAGGDLLAHKISVKAVTIIGGCLFFAFSCATLYAMLCCDSL